MFAEADMTPTGPAALLVGRLNGARSRGDKLLRLTNSSQPKTVKVGKVVTGPTCTLALYEGVSPEILKAATRGCQRLPSTLIPCSSVLRRKEICKLTAFFSHIHIQTSDHAHQKERVSHPQTPPARWACRDHVILAVKRHCGRDQLANYTAADVRANLPAKEGHHWYWSVGGEPKGFVIATREVTGSFIAVGERHGGENREAGASLAYRGKERE